jgi:hypothetical protein
MRKWKERNKEKVLQYFRAYRKANKERLDFLEKKRNPESARRAKRNYKLRHKAKVREAERTRMKIRWNTDVKYKLRVLAGTASHRMVKAGWTKRHRSAELIGCTWEELKAHIEAQFKPGMTWQNHSKFGWHIDHIRPLASFDLTQPDQMAAAMHYTNLQPLWWKENIIKSDKWQQPPGQMILF